MKHLIICREYPPAPIPPGGIGTYVVHIARLLAERGETVHIIAERWRGAAKQVEEQYDGRLIIHRIEIESWDSFPLQNPIFNPCSQEVKGLSQSSFPAQAFSWQAGLLAEKLVEAEGIDLIEAQEYEAPLYYFQLRRALGLGPSRKPPCIIHIHSLTEFIVRNNDWNLYQSNFLTAKRLEDYSIAAADALLCPSQYFANQVEAHYGMAVGTIKVIPLPIGDTPLLERDDTVWQNGSICYVGRLERRKGVLEWLDAAVSVAEQYPTATFEFIGANCLGEYDINGNELVNGDELVLRRIPDNLKPRFLFRGKQDRSVLPLFLKQARIAVVPSRWENFPNTCVEAMSSGLPVIVSPEGGMVEMVEEGRTGWLASSATPESLAIALKQALETPPAVLSAMGQQASIAIRRRCDNQRILEVHLHFRQQVYEQGAKRSLYLPANLPWAKQPLTFNSFRQTPQDTYEGIAVVILCGHERSLLVRCLQSLRKQTQKPSVVLLVENVFHNQRNLDTLDQFQQEGWKVIQSQNEDVASTKNLSIEFIFNSGVKPSGFVFLNSEYCLQPNFIADCETVLKQCSSVGLISSWVHQGKPGNLLIKPCPSFPYQWLNNESASFSVIRTEALLEVGMFRSGLQNGYEDWDLFNAVMVAEWKAVTLPAILVSRQKQRRKIASQRSAFSIQGKMYQGLIERFPEQVIRDGKELLLLSQSEQYELQHQGTFRFQKQRLFTRKAIAFIQQYKRDLLWRGQKRIEQMLLESQKAYRKKDLFERTR